MQHSSSKAFLRRCRWHGLLIVTSALGLANAPVHAQDARKSFDIAGQSAAGALNEFARQANIALVFSSERVGNLKTRPLKGSFTVAEALTHLLEGTPLSYQRIGEGTIAIDDANQSSSSRQDASRAAGSRKKTKEPVAGGSSSRTLDTVTVIGRKRRELDPDMPVAVSAFSAEQLDEQKIEGIPELLRGVPNLTFSKTNFASYNFQIRGIGTKALSASTDPAVAISFNNVPMVRNRGYEQEFFDMDRVEVLRGPQGTLYGRNATGGVVNLITHRPTDAFEGELGIEGGSFDTRRLSGFLNVPITESLAVRFAGAATERDGFDYNTVTRKNVNGRDLWGARTTVAWKPDERFRAELIWERFSEDDDRSRTGKQLCHHDPGPARMGRDLDAPRDLVFRALMSQGCQPGSLYDDAAFGVPNGLSFPHVFFPELGTQLRQLDDLYDLMLFGNRMRRDGWGVPVDFVDPYAGIVQSHDLRRIATVFDPVFRTENDTIQFNFDVDVTSKLKLSSQSTYIRDDYFSSQDNNRFNSAVTFADSTPADDSLDVFYPWLTPGGYFDDPQLGRHNVMVSADLVRAHSTQWSQEFRLRSSFGGPFDFMLGANYLKLDVDEDYYVFNNVFTILAISNFGTYDGRTCQPEWNDSCVYVDPNPVDRLNGLGHNYFRSRSLAEIRSWAVFGEGYWQISDRWKLTAGLRWTHDVKTSTPVKSQLLNYGGGLNGGNINHGYPESLDINQHWQEPTGRLALDWKPDLAFTDETLIYASYTRGYRAGGTNSPSIDFDPDYISFAKEPDTFRPEYVNAFEIGARNTLADGALSLNAAAFHYDYTGYQVSQYVDRRILTENFDAKMWGAELEAIWRPSDRFSINANLGLLRTRIADGMKSIDMMNRTQGNPDWVVMKPWPQKASNCIAPRAIVEKLMQDPRLRDAPIHLVYLCGGYASSYAPGDGFSDEYGVAYDPLTGFYDLDIHTLGNEHLDSNTNQGRGFDADLGGNELPNSPHWTFNLGTQYTFDLGDWDLTLRGDYYRQGKSWARVYNTSVDRLREWGNANASITLSSYRRNLTLQLYVKNLFDDTPIVDAFTNGDDTGLTTNVFTLDPRIVGISIRKGF